MSARTDEVFLFAVVLVVSIASLTFLAFSYWYIMRQDASVLTTVSASIGALVGYFFKLLRDRIAAGKTSEEEEKEE